jgi:hypothetical protein
VELKNLPRLKTVDGQPLPIGPDESARAANASQPIRRWM